MSFVFRSFHFHCIAPANPNLNPHIVILSGLIVVMGSVSRYEVSPTRIRFDVNYIQNVEESCPMSVDCVISVLSSLLERVLTRNDRLLASGRYILSHLEYKAFDAVEVPEMSINRYLERICKYVHCSASVLVVAYAYINRLTQYHLQFRITSFNVHRLLITSVMVASKFLEDLNFNNSYYAKVGGVSTQEINSLEMELLFLLDFKLQITLNAFESYWCYFERNVAKDERFERNASKTRMWLKMKSPATE